MTNYDRARYRGVRSAKPAKVRAAHREDTDRTPWRRPVRDNGHRIAHPARRFEVGFCVGCRRPMASGHAPDCAYAPAVA